MFSWQHPKLDVAGSWYLLSNASVVDSGWQWRDGPGSGRPLNRGSRGLQPETLDSRVICVGSWMSRKYATLYEVLWCIPRTNNRYGFLPVTRRCFLEAETPFWVHLFWVHLFWVHLLFVRYLLELQFLRLLVNTCIPTGQDINKLGWVNTCYCWWWIIGHRPQILLQIEV